MMIRHWRAIHERPVIQAATCQLWLAWLDDENPDEFQRLLSKDEHSRAVRLRGSQSANRFTVARGVLRILLSKYLALVPEEIAFTYGPNGKPALAGEIQKQLSFNLSHSGGMAVFAVANGLQIGVDVEKVHPIGDLEATASIFLTNDELVELKQLPTALKLERFFTMWTCKEAVLKALGSGYTGPVKDILATFSQTGKKGGQLTLFNPAEGFQGALACL
jgi:4'-phosphopantetheinyl transferase